MIHRWQRVLVFVLFSLLTGCFGFGGGDKEAEDMQPRFYIVDVDRGNVAAQFAQNRVLRIKPIRIAPHYRTENIVFRIGDNEYQPQAGHLLLTDPQVMFTSQLQRWLSKSGLFSEVITDDSQPADLVLEAAVTKLYGDERAEYPPQAVLEMQFFISPGDADRSKMLFQTGFRVDASIDQTTPQTVVTGWQNALEEILATLEQDLSDYFDKAGAP
ncbi:ABC-type transport auxiliary lipoprotein family protein [Methylophaga sp. UBA2689]|uniref:ABC-type transport auxiliary lipoprotein family protein n=1 Tax=Methylophaga sp. UBA2689 TaxID=1946878 RepID=UPI0025F8A68D|nr:ABC-type transport auxiliary lipoprotein family protein [Methylophaga sp. UBA2689]